MDKIWRVQNIDGQGCYRQVDDELLEMNPWRPSRQPLPEDDKGIDRRILEEEYCGFESKEQALQWFDTEVLLKLEQVGYMLTEIEGYITARGKCQVLFVKDRASFPEVNTI